MNYYTVVIQTDKNNQLINQQLTDTKTEKLLAPKNESYVYNNEKKSQGERSISDIEKFVVMNSKEPKAILSVKGSNTKMRAQDDLEQ